MRELVSATLFAIATVATIGVFLGQSAGGILASSGLIIAILGFAIRNVLADVLSGIAIGVEAPYRIGDWVGFDATIRGRVTEIGWRTTRILTPNDTYMILPNSQISRQMLTNYSAPRKQYQGELEIVLSHDISISDGKQLLFDAALSTSPAESLAPGQKPRVRATAYTAEGVTYKIKYWVPSSPTAPTAATPSWWPSTTRSAARAWRCPSPRRLGRKPSRCASPTRPTTRAPDPFPPPRRPAPLT
ncbi:mechanosensitive channel protein [Bordetella pertussis]|nr:mechanosensitive channel protein [Bordetella pertussis]